MPWVSFLGVGFVQSHQQGIYWDFCQQTPLAEGQLEHPGARDQPLARRISASSGSGCIPVTLTEFTPHFGEWLSSKEGL